MKFQKNGQREKVTYEYLCSVLWSFDKDIFSHPLAKNSFKQPKLMVWAS